MTGWDRDRLGERPSEATGVGNAWILNGWLRADNAYAFANIGCRVFDTTNPGRGETEL